MGNLWRKIGHLVYEIRCLFQPYNVLKIHELPRTWSDRDEVLFHAIFQVLVDFVELEQPLVHWDDRVRGRFTDRQAMWDFVNSWYGPNSPELFHYDEETIKRQYEFHSELMTLYEWYKDKKYELTVEDPSWVELEQNDLACDEMLRRVLAIRRCLWT